MLTRFRLNEKGNKELTSMNLITVARQIVKDTSPETSQTFSSFNQIKATRKIHQCTSAQVGSKKAILMKKCKQESIGLLEKGSNGTRFTVLMMNRIKR